MGIPWPTIAGWYHAVVLGALPWCLLWDARWAPLLAASVVLIHTYVRRTRTAEPWSSCWTLLVATIFVLANGGWRGPVWFWLAMAAVVAATARLIRREDGGRPDTADCLAVICWASPFAVEPGFLATTGGGWLAPAIMLVAARQIGAVGTAATTVKNAIGPPSRDVRGTLSLRGVVAESSGLPATVPIDLDLRAGESLAVLCDDEPAAQLLADLLAGRRQPTEGEILVDGAPLEADDRLATVVAPGEAFIFGDLVDNLGALREDAPDRSALGAARDACGLGEVIEVHGDRPMTTEGEPLEPFHRLLVLAARALVSHYRLLVAVDPGPWVDGRRTEIWRGALVRASVGRTAIWITNDVELAERADHVYEYANGALRPA